ncbi:histidine kinase dimerization/phospho-acceptor domain-containing protein, partial [Steroidobacter sp.]|uniref:histidine kinase dimerization/phospho-acceptor domain-containing protein n=1 Tax=Steroidobacter sp. TaxID=1978227 RepID=UPI001A47B57E
MNRSLHIRVVSYVLAVIGLVTLPLAIYGYRKTVQEFDELGDARLVQATRTIDVLAENAGLRDPQPSAPLDVLVWRSPFQEPTLTAGGHAYEVRLGFQFFNGADQLRMTSDNFQGLGLKAAPEGFSDLDFDGSRWRIFTIREEDGDTVRVGERYDSRNSIARDLIWEHVAPTLIALPLLAVLVGWAVRRALRPLDVLSHDLSMRRPDTSTPIELEQAPRELEPVLASLNELLSRVQSSLERERQFAADAAHQLRTPLTSALLHLDNAVADESAASRKLALGRAQEGLGRLRRLVNQFLELARWDSESGDLHRDAVDLDACVRAEVETSAHLAADKDLEVSVICADAPTVIQGWAPALHALAHNLIDNAFRYTPSSGRVQVRVAVTDAGP